MEKFPVLFPVSRELGVETGSHWTASATTCCISVSLIFAIVGPLLMTQSSHILAEFYVRQAFQL
jgi:hypothetical protein